MDVYYMSRLGYVNHNKISQDDRAVVVIDPEDAEQVARLTAAWEDVEVGVVGAVPMTVRQMRMQAALRNLIAPPKPEEPTGLGAVVESSTPTQYVRIGDGPKPWMILGGSPWSRESTYAWKDTFAVRVLSEGVAR